MQGQLIDGSGLTHIMAPWPWSARLRVEAYDIVQDGEHAKHAGYLDILSSKLGDRVVSYEDKNEISRQRIEVIDRDHLLVIPDEACYNRHVLRRTKTLLMLPQADPRFLRYMTV